MEEKKDFKAPKEWIDRIFVIMEEIYKEKWTQWQGSEKVKDLYKTIWRSGLYGLTVQEIKHGLSVCRSLYPNHTPPLVTEFYHYAKGIKKPIYRPYIPEVPVNKELAKKSIEQIKSKLRGLRST